VLEPTDKPDPLSSADRAVYDTTYFGRGFETVPTAGVFHYAYEADCAVRILGILANKSKDNANRQALLKLAQAVVAAERDKWLDEFQSRWRSEGSTTLNTGGDNESPSRSE
jgi:hypothetical protein